MNTNAERQLLDHMPDLVLSVSREGRVIGHGGGCAVPQLVPQGAIVGEFLESIWDATAAQLVKQLIRKAIASRCTIEAKLAVAGANYCLAVTAEGPARALCVVRPESCDEPEPEASPSGSFPRPFLDRRGFLRRFQEVVTMSALTEKPVALVALHLSGVDGIAALDAKAADHVVTAALIRLAHGVSERRVAPCQCVGQLSEDQLALVLDTADRGFIESLVADIQLRLGAPIEVDGAVFELACYAGVAVLGRDGGSTKSLLNHSRIAATEACRTASPRARFFSDTMKLKSLARLDVARELAAAIAADAIGTRYVGRYDLNDGRLVALVGYLRWSHPLRGDIAPREFLGVADATGVALSLSRSILASLAGNFDILSPAIAPDVRLSFGPLHHHLLHEDFLNDIHETLKSGRLPASRLEIRIAEKTLIALPPGVCKRLAGWGLQIVIDEVGRGLGSLDRMARAPLWGMQLDRAWAEGMSSDPLSRRICRAGIASAIALGVAPIATGVDNELQRQALRDLGCSYGIGDLYTPTWSSSTASRQPPRRRVGES